jgi:HD-like signal output (HDOD) protein
MFGWLSKLLDSDKAQPVSKGKAPLRPPAPKTKPGSPASESEAKPLPQLPTRAREFFATLFLEGPAADLQTFPMNDRAFLAAVMRKSNEGELAIPVLPDAALRIQELLNHPNVEVGQFVEVFRTDPALSAELLKVANSAYYGFTAPTHDLSQAILRVGFNQIRAIVVMAALRSKVLQGRHFHSEVEWITDLALATARACQDLSRELRVEPGEAFTRGLLCHVEYFAILGMAADFAAHHQKEEGVSQRALAVAMHRLGPGVIQLIAKRWGLPMLGSPPSGAEDPAVTLIRKQIGQVATELALAWSGLETNFTVEHVDPETVKKAVVKAISDMSV